MMPWNANHEYNFRFARLVRNRLAAGPHVYAEVGNEVWNGGLSVARKAVD